MYANFMKDENQVLSNFVGYSEEFWQDQDLSKEITSEEHSYYIDQVGNYKKLLWANENEEIQLRDQNTKWDVSQKTFVPDEDKIRQQKIDEVKSECNDAFNNYIIFTQNYFYNKLTHDQQNQLTAYLDALQEIINGNNATELPQTPEFLTDNTSTNNTTI